MVEITLIGNKSFSIYTAEQTIPSTWEGEYSIRSSYEKGNAKGEFTIYSNQQSLEDALFENILTHKIIDPKKLYDDLALNVLASRFNTKRKGEKGIFVLPQVLEDVVKNLGYIS